MLCLGIVAVTVASARAAGFVTVDFPGAIYTVVNGGPNSRGDVAGQLAGVGFLIVLVRRRA